MIKRLRAFIIESIIDPKQEALSTDLFENPKDENPRLKEKVQKYIEAGIASLGVNVTAYTLIGSTLTLRYTDDSDIDLNLLGEGDEDEIRKITTKASGKLIPGTKHPVNYHILTNKKDYDHANDIADSVFDIKNNKFIRRSEDTDFDVSRYMDAYKQKASKIDLLKQDLKDNLLDYAQLKERPKNELKELKKLIQKELDEISDDANEIVDLYNKIKDERRKAFARPITAKDIREYGSKNKLPENVIFKLLEKHHYLDFMQKVDDIIGDNGKVSDAEAKKLVKLAKKE